MVVFGVVLFPITLAMALLLPTTEKALRRWKRDRAWEQDFRECPSCHEDIRAQATACPYCHIRVVPMRIAITDDSAVPKPASRRGAGST